MRIEYDREVDALYISLKEEAKPVDTRDIEEGVTIDVDEGGHIVGIEILDASDRLGWESLLKVSIENMPLEKAPA